MKFNKQELIQLNKALSTCNQEQAFLIKRLLTQLARNDTWFFGAITNLLNNGIKITCANVDHIGRYYYETKTLVINSLFLNSYNTKSKSNLLLKIVLRHEVTHALDFLGITIDEQKRLIPNESTNQTLLNIMLLANTLIDQLNCVNSKRAININSLTQLSKLNLTVDNNPKFISLSVAKDSYPSFQRTKELLELLGSSALIVSGSVNTTSFIVTQEPLAISNSFLIESTRDCTVALRSFEATARARHFFPSGEIENDFEKLMERCNLLFWQSMETKQKQTLDLLFTWQDQLVTAVAPDERCYPILKSCISYPVENCFKNFYYCQLETNHNYAVTTLLETRAVFFERSYGDKIDSNFLLSLCDLSEETQVSLLPDSKTVQLMASQFSCGVSYGVLNELTATFIENQKIKYGNIIKLSLSASFVLGISYINYQMSDQEDASRLPIFLPTAILLLLKGIEEGVERYTSSKISKITKMLLSSLFVGTQLATNSVTELVTNVAASSFGNWVGTKVVRTISGFFSGSNQRLFPTFFQHLALPAKLNSTQIVENENNKIKLSN